MAFTIIRHNVLNDQAATQQTQVAGNSLEIGRGSGNALLLDDLHISLRHAVIEYVDGRYVIKDLDSRGGTYVNHRAVRMQPLSRWRRRPHRQLQPAHECASDCWPSHH